MDFSEFQKLCEARHAVHAFDSKPLTRQTIERLLEVAHLAPSVGNIQPWRFHVVLDLALLMKLVDCACYGNFIAGAGACVVVTCDESINLPENKVLWNIREPEYSCAMAIDHLLLAATSMGLGSCPISFHHGAAHSLLKLPLHERIVAGVLVGTPGLGEEPAHERRALQEVVRYYE